MTAMVTRGSTGGDADRRRADRAAALADLLLRRSLADASRAERRRGARLGRIVADPVGRDLVQRLTDEVLRLDDDRIAALRFSRLVKTHPTSTAFGPFDRLLLHAGARLAPRMAGLVMPLVRRRIVGETRGMVNPAEDPALGRHIRERRDAGADLNLNVLGEAILSDREAEQRVARVIEVIRRADVDYVSVKISALCAQLDVAAFEYSVVRIATVLRSVFDAALGTDAPVFINLDMEEYADVHLTVAAFTTVLDERAYWQMPAGIVLQAYLPDSHGVLEHLGGWASTRVRAGAAPIKVRIVKGANLAMERVDAEQHGWVQAPYATKQATDASYKRLLDSALRPQWADAIRVGVASHNLFDVAWALMLRDELPRERRGSLAIEMLEGMVPAQARAVRATAGGLRFYCPIVRSNEVEASLAYLARRFDENTAPENFLRAMFTMRPGSADFREQERRFRRAVAERHDVLEAPRRPGVATRPDGFSNEPETDFTDAATRAAIWAEVAADPQPADPQPADPQPAGPPVLDDVGQIDGVVAAASAAFPGWAARGHGARSAMILAVAEVISIERNRTLAVMAHEAGKTVHEGDPEVCEAIDLARYYAISDVPHHADPRGVVVVASPWNFPYAIPAGGVFAALVAGNAVILKPPPETRRTAWLLAQQCWRGGVPRDVLQFVACPDDEIGRRLITHPDVDTVVLTGAYATARMFHEWRPTLRLLAETSGKNALVVTGSADHDAAIRDIVRSAFGHAGQKCSACSLAILTPAVHDDPVFLARLADAVRTLRPGPATDPATTMGPLIAPPGGSLQRALTTLDPGEQWLVRPRPLDAGGTLWSPGVRIGVAPGSWFHTTECFGPVLGVMRADDLDHAIALQNGTPFGLTGGIHSLDDSEVHRWLAGVQVGNAYVNRHITGAIVRRQPFGGWKNSSVGGGPKAGGAHYVAAFVRQRATPVDPAAADASYRAAWSARFGRSLDESGLRSEDNLVRYRPLRRVVLRAGPDTPRGALDAALAAARCCSTPVTLSLADEPFDVLAARLAEIRPARLRLLGTDMAADAPGRVAPSSGNDLVGLLRACHRLDVAVDTAPVAADGRFELIHWVHEQSVSITRHRYGRITR